MRRQQGNRFVSVHQLESSDTDYIQSALLTTNNPIIDVKSGGNTDFSAHGLIWTPMAKVIFGNVANKAQGAAVGGHCHCIT